MHAAVNQECHERKQMEERLIHIESKLAHQEYLLDVLNQTVYKQQIKLDELDALCVALAKRLADVHAGTPDALSANEKPPHY
jgi:SlyX protein